MKFFVLKWIAVPLLICEAVGQTTECAKVTRHGGSITMVADSIRVVDTIANTLAQQFNVIVSAEEPSYRIAGDFEKVRNADPQWTSAHPKAIYEVPKRRKIELKFDVLSNGSPNDVRLLLKQIVERANAETPFGYRLDVDGEFFTLVPTTTRNVKGHIDAAKPLLDRKVTIPSGTRTIAETAKMMADALSAQTGLKISCCEAYGAGKPWGMKTAQFEAHDESARKVLEELIRLDQQSNEVSSRKYWLLRCDSGWCFINLMNVGGANCRWSTP